ncbi:MAG: CGGC domain-containing protein [Desulfobacteraceae bacterium]
MSKIAIMSCQNIKDKMCIGCITCFKAMQRKDGEFARYKDDIEVVAMCDCGGCPGLAMPKLNLVKHICNQNGVDFDTLHIGTCLVKATKTSGCPIDLDKLKKMIEDTLGKEVVIGTHNY